jgi:uncharacterized protein YdeI (BOF family)
MVSTRSGAGARRDREIAPAHARRVRSKSLRHGVSTMLPTKTLLVAIAAVGLLATPTLAQDPYEMADDTWISLSGEVESVSADEFLLDYGGGMVTVEMDDGDRDADGYKLVRGDDVTVTGVVDDDFFEATTIEAGSVYVEKLGTYFYASTADEEDRYITIHGPTVNATAVVQGTVTEVRDHEFVVDTDARSITVDVSEMLYNPLDDTGYQQVEPGDMVSASGTVDYDFFEGREIMAETVTTLVKNFDPQASK